MDAGIAASIATVASAIVAAMAAIFGPIIISKLDTIHTNVNSNLAAVTAELKNANLKIEGLVALIGEMRKANEK